MNDSLDHGQLFIAQSDGHHRALLYSSYVNALAAYQKLFSLVLAWRLHKKDNVMSLEDSFQGVHLICASEVRTATVSSVARDENYQEIRGAYARRVQKALKEAYYYKPPEEGDPAATGVQDWINPPIKDPTEEGLT